MAFFTCFKKSALELKSVKCLAVTAMLIALACVLKSLTIQPMPTLKIGFSFLAIASIGMLYGPTVGALACVATDVIGYLVSNQSYAFSPLFTLVEVTGGVIYGLFLYNFNPIKPDFTSAKKFFEGLGSNLPALLRLFAAKFTINLVCNVFMNTLFMAVMGYYATETLGVHIWERVIKNAVMLPIEVLLLILTMFPIKAAYRAVFKNKQANV
ncbi:MAG: folate family ECF transporter S component [Eubacterium sp.]|nr:folate family ECF transporter S component [Eubacterium sp.]